MELLIRCDYDGDEKAWESPNIPSSDSVDADDRLRGRFSCNVARRDSDQTLKHLPSRPLLGESTTSAKGFGGDWFDVTNPLPFAETHPLERAGR